MRQFPNTTLLFFFDTVGFREKYCSLFQIVRVFIQSDSVGNVNILGGDSICHYEKKRLYEHLSSSEWLSRKVCLNLAIFRHLLWTVISFFYLRVTNLQFEHYITIKIMLTVC